MGLAAGQARLLTITGRKSDCEFESMRLSHQKIAIARELADLSNQYQDSLDYTKLVYDYYGTGDTTNPLSYGIMMSPSILNDYMPITLTDSMNRVVLNSRYAAAARAAGIPQEGLGTLPSETVRNSFVSALGEQGIIPEYLTKKIQELPYNQRAGLGGGPTVAVVTETGNIDDFINFLAKNGSDYTLDKNNFPTVQRKGCKTDDNAEKKDWQTSVVQLLKINTGAYDGKLSTSKAINGIKDGESFDTYFSNANTPTSTTFTLSNLLENTNNFQYYLGYNGIQGEQCPVYGVALMQDILNGGFLDWIGAELSEFLDLNDGATERALEYAKTAIYELLNGDGTGHDNWRNRDDGKETDDNTQSDKDEVKKYLQPIGTPLQPGVGKWGEGTPYDEWYQQKVVYDSKDYVGFTYVASKKGGQDDGNDHTTGGINLNNIAKAYLTYFADFLNGVAKTDQYGNEDLKVAIGGTSSNRLITDNKNIQLTWKVGSEVSSDDLGQAQFYDALFNQLCVNGWTENDNVTDNDYIQKMLENGMMYITKMKEDGYYYQGNYATDNYIKVVADDRKIAAAEAKYNTEKAKLNAKEQTLDMKMKNLDTEISSLTTEYDTIKNTLSKNIEKSFKRYSA